jgi:citrate lyase subunit beta/citryl-CoA lyase
LLPVCDHYSGAEARMVKSLQLQADMMEEFGACVFDVTLDCEDGARVGGEKDQAEMVCALTHTAYDASKNIADGVRRRVGARLHSVEHPAFMEDVQIVVGRAGPALSYVMIPKVESVDDVQAAIAAIDVASARFSLSSPLPLHVLIESPSAVRHAFDIAGHPRVESVSFGLMDFVSAHAGAIPSSAMGVRPMEDHSTLDQFHHPLVVRAKCEISSACHASGKVPSHCVVTEFRDQNLLSHAAFRASKALGFTRMWSIHPDQIRPILGAFSPSENEIDMAGRILEDAIANEWAPISVKGALHDRASFRYFWQVLERAHQTGGKVPESMRGYLSTGVH